MVVLLFYLFLDFEVGKFGGRKRIKLPDEQLLLSKILRNYDTASRPVFNASHTVTVKFGYTLTQIADMVRIHSMHL